MSQRAGSEPAAPSSPALLPTGVFCSQQGQGEAAAQYWLLCRGSKGHMLGNFRYPDREQNVLRAKSSQIYTHRACSSCLSLLHSWEPSPSEGKQLSQGLAEEQGTSRVPFGKFSVLFHQAVIKFWHVVRAGSGAELPGEGQSLHYEQLSWLQLLQTVGKHEGVPCLCCGEGKIAL